MRVERDPLGEMGLGVKDRLAFIVSDVYIVNLLWDIYNQGHPLSCQPMAPALHSALRPHHPGPGRGPQWVGDTEGILCPEQGPIVWSQPAGSGASLPQLG